MTLRFGLPDEGSDLVEALGKESGGSSNLGEVLKKIELVLSLRQGVAVVLLPTRLLAARCAKRKREIALRRVDGRLHFSGILHKIVAL